MSWPCGFPGESLAVFFSPLNQLWHVLDSSWHKRLFLLVWDHIVVFWEGLLVLMGLLNKDKYRIPEIRQIQREVNVLSVGTFIFCFFFFSIDAFSVWEISESTIFQLNEEFKWFGRSTYHMSKKSGALAAISLNSIRAETISQLTKKWIGRFERELIVCSVKQRSQAFSGFKPRRYVN